jgi:hypothetical protein
MAHCDAVGRGCPTHQIWIRALTCQLGFQVLKDRQKFGAWSLKIRVPPLGLYQVFLGPFNYAQKVVRQRVGASHQSSGMQVSTGKLSSILEW